MTKIIHKTALILSVLIIFANGRKGFGPGEQDWGYVTVRPEAHMFWWLYETTANVSHKTDSPLVIWLQGGPGSSSAGFGNFEELGPLDIKLKTRNYTWVKNMNVLFIDNPVGTGFSYVDNTSALATSSNQTTEDFITCLIGFYQKYPEFQNVSLYIVGESYGGKFAVEFALQLHNVSRNEIKAGNMQSNLQGIGLIDSWISPIDSVLTWAPYLYNFGVVDREGYNKIDASAKKVKAAIDVGDYRLATAEWSTTQTIIGNTAFGVDWYNILTKISFATLQANSTDSQLEEFMNGPVKTALDLNVTWKDYSWDVFYSLEEEFMKSDTNIVEQLLSNTDIKLSIICGQLDLIVDTPGTIHWVDRLQWSKSNKWHQIPRVPFSVNGFNEGYKKVLGQLTLYWVNRSGHMVPKDNPAAMEAIMNELIEKTS